LERNVAGDALPHADSLSIESIGNHQAKMLAAALQTNTSLTSLK
jgi:hypothetical protein